MTKNDSTMNQQRLDTKLCHSVVAHGKTSNLNYDEVVVYRDDAVLTRYLIFYSVID